MVDKAVVLPDDPADLRAFTARLLVEVKAQAILIEKLRHQLAGHRAHRFGARPTARYLPNIDKFALRGDKGCTIPARDPIA